MYKFISYNENGQAVVEANSGVWEPSYTLRLPMETLYAEEVSYVLDTEDWQDPKTKDMPWEYEDGLFGKEFTYDQFIAGDTPKFISWWISTLPNTTLNYGLRRKLWKRRLTHQIRKLLNKLLSRLLSKSM